jgi:hypothetical protein
MNEPKTTIDQVRESATIAFDLEQPMHREEAVFGAIAEILTDCNHLTLPQWAPLSMKAGRKTVTAHGYELDEDLEILTIFHLVDCHEKTDLHVSWERMPCPLMHLERAVADLEMIVSAACEGSLPLLDEADPANDMCRLLQRFAKKDKSRICLCVWTTGELSKEGWKRSTNSVCHTSAWDATRICNALDSGHETLTVSFQDVGGIDCLLEDTDHQKLLETGSAVLLGKIPGECLANLYFEHRTRLLQQNVRAFLNLTGVNKGIRDTIKTEPERFLSYNNGIAVTASKITLERQAPGVYRLLAADDFQIVNGGQTTAALMHTRLESNADLKPIQVAMKLTVVRPQDLDDLVPKISLYANSQNKVQEADFASNNPWLVKLEDISRMIEAPKDEKSNGQPLRWYFERVRGQYNVDLAKQNGGHQKTAFKAKCPPRSRFSKTDLSTTAITWEAEPHVVSLGRQKCFGSFIRKLSAAKEMTHGGNAVEPSEEDFRRIACLLILRRDAVTACRELEISTIRSSAITYAIALLSARTKGRLPFTEIWNTQAIPPVVSNCLRIALKGCERILLQQASAKKQIVTELAKKEECWKAILDEPIQLDFGSIDGKWDTFSVADTVRTAEMVEATEVFFRITDAEWVKISSALEEQTQNPAYPGVAATMAKYALIRKKPSDKQARILAKGLIRLKDAGIRGCGLGKLMEADWALLKGVAVRK